MTERIPYDYTVVRMRRKTFSARIVGAGKVEVRIPLRATLSDARAYLARIDPWIRKHLARYVAERQGTEALAAGTEVLLDGRRFPVVAGARTQFDGSALSAPSAEAIVPFLKRRAKILLKPELDALSAALGIPYKALRIGSARSRWGSCTADGNIMLNYRLVCLRPEVRRYVMVHELCHRKQLNHSAAFWAAVSEACPDCKSLRAELKRYAFLMDRAE